MSQEPATAPDAAELSRDACPGCGGTTWREAYRGEVRAGRDSYVQGKVIACEGCGLQQLAWPSAPDYSTDAYRLAYNGTADSGELMAMHAAQAEAQAALVGDVAGLTVVDVGCGHGAFLNRVRARAMCTVGIEPQSSMHAHLLRHDINVFSSAPEFLLKWQVPRPADVVTSFGVIEHLADPLAHLHELKKIGRAGGTLMLQTDNLDDVLMKTGAPGFARHFYRTAHRWYFRMEHIVALLKRAGIEPYKVRTTHEYDFENFKKWNPDPPWKTGPQDDRDWKRAIEVTGQGSLITVKATL